MAGRKERCVVMSRRFLIVVFVVTTAIPLRTARAEDSGAVCVPPEVSERATQCPDGLRLSPSKLRTGAPASTVAVSQRRDQARPEKTSEPEGPGIDESESDEIRRGVKQKQEAQSYDLLRRQAVLTQKLISNTPEDDAEMPRRRQVLASIHEELGRHMRGKVRALDDPIYRARQEGRNKLAAKLSRDQHGHEEEEDRWRGQAIEQYDTIAKRHSGFPRRDEILYRQAFLLEEQASSDHRRRELAEQPVPSRRESELRDEARRVYRELIRSYPESRFVPFAYLSFGEHFFQEGQMDAALRFYERVTQTEGSPIEGYALYKMAWCHINLQQDREALSHFVRVIEHSRANPDSTMAGPLSRQSRLELIAPFARAFGPGRAWEFFQRVGGDRALPMMESLAQHYYDQGQWADASATYHSLMAHNENGDHLCLYQTRVAQCSLRGGARPDQVVELRRTVDLMNTFVAQDHPADDERDCRRELAQLLVEVATHWHQEAVGSDTSPGTGDTETMELASQVYRLALDELEDLDDLELEGWSDENRPTRYRLSYWAAELLWQRHLWAQCGPAFDSVVEVNPSGEYLQEAAYAAVLCYDNMIQEQRSEEEQLRARRTPRERRRRNERQLSEEEQERIELEALRPRELSDSEASMLAAFTRYLCHVDESEDLVRIKYRRARIYYEANQLEEAATLFRDIADNHSSNELAPYAANLYLDSLNAIGLRNEERHSSCVRDMSDGVDRYLADGDLVREEEHRLAFTRLRCGLRWQRAEEHSRAGEHRQCAQLYLSIYRDHSEDCREIGEHGLDEVLYNSAICLEADYRIGQAIEVRRRLIQEFGEGSNWAEERGRPSPLAQRAIYQIGGNYHAIAYYTKAAEVYERFAERYPGEDEAPLALRNATVFRLGLGQHKLALKNSRLFERNYGRRQNEETATVLLSVGGIFLHQKQWSRAADHYRSFLSRYGNKARPDEAIRARVALGYSLWNLEGRTREGAQRELRKAIAIADRGRPTEETTRHRLARYRKLIAPGENPEERNGELTSRLIRMVDAVAKARFLVAEQAYEDFEAIELSPFRPSSKLTRSARAFWTKHIGQEKARGWEQMLRFLPPDERRRHIANVHFEQWNETELGPWVERRDEARARAQNAYVTAMEEDVPEWEIAAAARVGEMYRSMMQSFYDAPIPPIIEEDEELRAIYEQRLDELAAPYRQTAIEAYGHCLSEATSNRWFNRWSVGCERELHRLSPRDYPMSDELRAQPDHTASPLASPMLVMQLGANGG